MQKTPLLQLHLTPSVRFVPQKDSYVNFYDHHTKKNYAMRFKDAASSEAFRVVVELVEAQLVVRRLETGTCLTWRPAVDFSSLAPPPRVSVECAQASRVKRRRLQRAHLFLLDLVDPDLVTYQDNDDLLVPCVVETDGLQYLIDLSTLV
ncbi:hypothetical protein PsorP6_006742 [Peronosclerospora sorghi]|uniref:Uncharacterized protein n=1 Tax=Peronosclerospora sorghi TaxID=230839 RepID=A0ACC0W1N7_9STRA|nr:hypothetical protein PsorP6_006742 [Peronosclerospora sorghi]